MLWGWNSLEADFIRFYQMDLYDQLYRKQISSRKMFVLIAGLPPDSAFMRFVSDKNQYSLPKLLT